MTRALIPVAALVLAACSDRPSAREVCADIAAAVCAVEAECLSTDAVVCAPIFEARCCEANHCTDEDWETDSSPEGVADCLDAIADASCELFGGYLPDECRPPR